MECTALPESLGVNCNLTCCLQLPANSLLVSSNNLTAPARHDFEHGCDTINRKNTRSEIQRACRHARAKLFELDQNSGVAGNAVLICFRKVCNTTLRTRVATPYCCATSAQAASMLPCMSLSHRAGTFLASAFTMPQGAASSTRTGMASSSASVGGAADETLALRGPASACVSVALRSHN